MFIVPKRMASSIALVALVMVSPAYAAPPPRFQNDVPAQLSDYAAIQTWANKTGAGGASVEVLKSRGAEVIVVQRSFTSGLMTSGLAVFVRAGDHWEPGLALRTAVGYRFDIAQSGDNAILRNSLTGREVARFSISTLGRDATGK